MRVKAVVTIVLVALFLAFIANLGIDITSHTDKNKVIEIVRDRVENSLEGMESLEVGKTLVSDSKVKGYDYVYRIEVYGAEDIKGEPLVFSTNASSNPQTVDYRHYNIEEEIKLDGIPKEYRPDLFKDKLEVSGNSVKISYGGIDRYAMDEYFGDIKLKDLKFNALTGEVNKTLSPSDKYVIVLENKDYYYSVILSREGNPPNDYSTKKVGPLEIRKKTRGTLEEEETYYILKVDQGNLDQLSLYFRNEKEREYKLSKEGQSLYFDTTNAIIGFGTVSGLDSCKDLPITVTSPDIPYRVDCRELQGKVYKIKVHYKVTEKGKVVYQEEYTTTKKEEIE